MATKRKSTVVSELLHCYTESSEQYVASKGDISRIKSLRPSQLPFCPPNFFIQHATHGALRTLDMRGAFFTSIGTAVHTAVQTYMGTSGKFLANWKCSICGTKHVVSMQNECCDFPMEYDEIHLNYRGIVGHIDGVFKDKNGDYYIIDYKTTSVKSIDRKSKNPGPVYRQQVEAYALLLWLEHGIKVKGVILMFILRDSPLNPKCWIKELDDEDFRVIKNRMVRYKKEHKRVLAIETLADALALRSFPKCRNPYCKTCRSSESLTKRLTKAHAIGQRFKRLPLINL